MFAGCAKGNYILEFKNKTVFKAKNKLLPKLVSKDYERLEMVCV
jgi:hypothetical protein